MRFGSIGAAMTASAVALSLSLVGCDVPEEDIQEIPEVVEEAPVPETAVRELKKEIVLGPEDEGETIIATGWVDGKPLDDGFFLRTEYNRLVFIETEQDVTAAQAVRVRGRVHESDATRFNAWEIDALGKDLKPDWDVWRGIYLDAETVEPMP